MKKEEKRRFLAERNEMIYREYLDKSYTLSDLGEIFNLDKKQISNILTGFLKKKE